FRSAENSLSHNLRQPNDELGVLPILRLEDQLSLVSLDDDVVADRQAEAGAGAGGLGGEEGVEDLVADGLGDAVAVVADADLDALAEVLGADAQLRCEPGPRRLLLGV